MIDSNPDVASIFRNDGKVLCYHSPYDNFVQNQGLVIRQDWLDEQGLELPTTYDQMFEVLKVFRGRFTIPAPPCTLTRTVRSTASPLAMM